jgi:serine phosphatase RsbU (regulator of sigma subunit)
LALDDLLDQILDGLFELFPQADRGYVLLADEAEGHLTARAMKHRSGDDGLATMGPVSRKVAARAMNDCQAILSTDGPRCGHFDLADSVVRPPSRSMLCAPLTGPSGRPRGVIHIDTQGSRPFTREDLELLLSVATVAGLAVEYAHEHQARLELSRRDRDLALAKKVQRQFLQQQRPEIDGYRFHDYYRAADEIGGDYFGYVPLPDGRLALAIGDVAGKGIAAALLMARLCSDARYCLASSATPAEAMTWLNRELLDGVFENRFVTFLLAVLDPRSHTLTLVNAGHLPPLLRRASGGQVERLSAESGQPLGFNSEACYSQFEVRLEPGDLLLLRTDGIDEARNTADQVYGATRLESLLASGPADIEEFAGSLLGDLRRFLAGQPQADDLCLLCLSRMR